jgi:DNA segregation ATPase FtsK/SpoIIIE, S-DNA-T family
VSDRDVQTGIELRCTLLDARSSLRRDVQVVAPMGATLADLLAACGTDLSSTTSVAVGACPVPADHPLGRPPLLHGCLIVLGGPSTKTSEVRGTGLHLDVVGGPDAGRTVPLGPGDYVLGRSEPADLRVDDTQVSRRHALLQVSADAVTGQDLGSTNGTWLTQDDEPGAASTVRLGGHPQALRLGARLRLGRSTVELRVPTGRPASTRLTGTGLLDVNRPPRATTPVRPVVLTAPAPVEPPPRAKVPWVGMAVPLVLCLGAAWLLRQPSYLLFGLMSPLILAGTAAADRLTRGRSRRRLDEAWRQQVQAAEERAALALRQERAALRRTVGDPALLLRVARLPTSRLWERTPDSPDLLLLAVGTGDVRSSTVSWAGDDPDAGGSTEADRRGEQPWSPPAPVMGDAPVTVSLVEQGHLGLCGDRPLALRLARWLVGQLTVWVGPDTLELLVVADEGTDEWDWARWLPHVATAGGRSTSDQAAYLDDRLRRRWQQQTGAAPDTRLVVLLDGGHLAHLPGVAAALADGAEVGLHVVCLADERSSLPSACGAVVDVHSDGGATLECGGESTELSVDGTRRAWAQTVARALAPLRDATPTAGRLPNDMSLPELLEVDPTSTDALVDGWRRRPRSTRAVVGRRVDGPFEIDLATDGPHLLVGGTTGSGKSELLRTLVTSLAVTNRPDEMTFVLVDYKGGAAFQGCAELVHTAGLVTDLDDQLAARALDSLDSELRRRERLLHDAGCRDVAEYQARRDDDPALPSLPRLVLVIDEFRALASELPDFLEGIVRVASLGRSLGVHVVLATQRPGGVVTADIKANVNLRICLRVRDRVDSDDVLDDGAAAAISPDTPGRALARRGGDALVAVQIARVDDAPRPAPDRTIVVPLADRDWFATARPDQGGPIDGTGGDLRRIVEACAAAAERLGIAAPPPVWTPPLPDRLPLIDAEGDGGDLDAGHAVVGLVDLPRQQRRQRLSWHPGHDGHLAIAGASRTGRTSAVLTIAAGLVRRWAPVDLHLHVIDAGQGALCGLADLPHTGTVVTADQPRLVARLVERLLSEVADRRRRGRDDRGPVLVLLVDGWEALTERLEGVDHGRPVDQLLSLVRDGESVGLRAVVAGGRGVLLSRVAAVVGHRLMLRPNDPTDLLLAGVAPSALPSSQPPGRAVRSTDGAHVQIALPPALDDLVSGAARRWPSWRDVAPARRALRLRPLPDVVDAAGLVWSPPPGRWALVGCGGDDAGPVGIDLAADRFALVAGPPGSGRSTALTSMARSLHAAGVDVLAICPRPSPLAEGPWQVRRLDQLAEARHTPQAAELLARPQVLLIDDVERLRDHPWETVLCQVADDPAAAGVVAAGTTSTLLASFRGLAGIARVHRTGVLLRPESAGDGEVLGIRAQLDDHSPVGRGLLVVRGQQTAVQVAIGAMTARADPGELPGPLGISTDAVNARGCASW